MTLGVNPLHQTCFRERGWRDPVVLLSWSHLSVSIPEEGLVKANYHPERGIFDLLEKFLIVLLSYRQLFARVYHPDDVSGIDDITHFDDR